MSNNGVVVRADRLPDFKTIEQWGAGLRWLIQFHKNWRWAVGEYLVKGDERYGEMIWQYIDPHDLGLKSRQDVSNAMYVFRACREQYTPEIQEWTFWQSMAPLKPKERDAFITRALSGEKIHRDEIRSKSHSNGFSRNGASEVGILTTGPPDGKSVAATNLAEQIVVVGKLLQGSDDEAGLSDALDALIDAAMALKEKLSAPTAARRWVRENLRGGSHGKILV